MKKKSLLLVLSLSLVLSAVGCNAKPEPEAEIQTEEADVIVEQEFEFYSDDEHLIMYNFPEGYEENGKNYKITEDEVNLETLGTRDTVQTIVDINVEELEDIEETYEYEAPSGKTYELENEQVYIEKQGIVPIAVVEEVYYEDQIGKPEVPAEKMITYFDRAEGKDKEIEGLLESLEESTPGRWKPNLEITGTFMAPVANCHEYEVPGIANVTVSRDAAKPTWPGYEADVLTSMGLSSKYFRVTDASWSGGQYEKDGYIMRDSLFTGDMFVSTYRATYVTEREAEGYDTKVFYRVDASAVDAAEEDITTVYHIKAIVKYKLMK